MYGYRSEQARQNCHFNHSGHAVYPTAALGVIFNYKENKQLHFGGGKTDMSAKRKQLDDSGSWHTDDITAMTMSADRRLVASGQNGVKPSIILWDATTAAHIE